MLLSTGKPQSDNRRVEKYWMMTFLLTDHYRFSQDIEIVDNDFPEALLDLFASKPHHCPIEVLVPKVINHGDGANQRFHLPKTQPQQCVSAS